MQTQGSSMKRGSLSSGHGDRLVKRNYVGIVIQGLKTHYFYRAFSFCT